MGRADHARIMSMRGVIQKDIAVTMEHIIIRMIHAVIGNEEVIHIAAVDAF